VISKPKIPYINRIYMVLANPTHTQWLSSSTDLPWQLTNTTQCTNAVPHRTRTRYRWPSNFVSSRKGLGGPPLLPICILLNTSCVWDREGVQQHVITKSESKVHRDYHNLRVRQRIRAAIMRFWQVGGSVWSISCGAKPCANCEEEQQACEYKQLVIDASCCADLMCEAEESRAASTLKTNCLHIQPASRFRAMQKSEPASNLVVYEVFRVLKMQAFCLPCVCCQLLLKAGSWHCCFTLTLLYICRPRKKQSWPIYSCKGYTFAGRRSVRPGRMLCSM